MWCASSLRCCPAMMPLPPAVLPPHAPAAPACDLRALLADSETPARVLCDALYDAGWQRLRAGATASALSPAEGVCMDALTVQAEVLNGGFQQWVENGYDERAHRTLAALEEIGAPRAAHLLRQALGALPERVQRAIAPGATDRALPDVTFGPHRTAYFAHLDDAYEAVARCENVDALVADFARGFTAWR